VVRQVVKQKLKVGGLLVLMIGFAFLSWNWRNEVKRSGKVRFEKVVDFGFEAFATGDWYNAEEILSSLFDKFGNELALYRKMDRCRQLKARSLYGYLLFRKGNFKKSERVFRPIFKDVESMNELVLSGKSQRKVLLFYLTALKELKKSQEVLRIFNRCYDSHGNSSEILKRFGDTSSMRVMAGEVFYQNDEYEKATAVLKIFFENFQLYGELDDCRKAMVRWYYVSSLLHNEGEISSEKKEIISKEFSEFFDENMKATNLFNKLSEKNQICCRLAYAQLLLKSDNYEQVLNLLGVLFDANGKMLLQPQDLREETNIRNVYGYALWKRGKHEKANKIWRGFSEEKNEEFAEDAGLLDENEWLKSLKENIIIPLSEI